MNNKKKIFIVCLVAMLLAIATFAFHTVYSKNKIERILKTDAYIDLPEQAKQLIRDNYNETGVVLKTEKNKEDGLPYLNPVYVEYLNGDQEDEAIPEVMTVDYNYSSDLVDITTVSNMSYYSLADDDYVTPFKNQKSLGICWSYATYGQLESLLAKQNGNKNTILSERQLDYASSTNGFKDYTNSYGTHYLGDGNYYQGVLPALITGESGAESTNVSYASYMGTEQKEVADIYNYDMSSYIVDGTVTIPSLSNKSAEGFDNYVNTVKYYIYNYGGAYVGTFAPNYIKSGVTNTYNGKTTHLIRTTSYIENEGHAMQAIGWDDNYTYSYCIDSNKNLIDASSCTDTDTKVEGQGAWILKNSWGSSSAYAYVYLAYDSYGSEFNTITDIENTADKTWDNSYIFNQYGDYAFLYTTYNLNNTFSINSLNNKEEKLEAIKFYNETTNGSYDIYIGTANNGTFSYQKIDTVSITLPGLYTYEIPNKYNITDNSFKIRIVGSSTSQAISSEIVLFTSNVENEESAYVEDKEFDLNAITTSTIDSRFLTKTSNIASGEELTYELTSSDNVTVPLVVSNNTVAINEANSYISFSSDIDTGEYSLKIKHGDNTLYTAKVTIVKDDTKTVNLDGTGTESDPYLIKTADDFKQMNKDLTAYYKVANDISDNGEYTIGSDNNYFSGSFDGDNHKIDTSIHFAGIIPNTNHDTEIKNLVLTNQTDSFVEFVSDYSTSFTELDTSTEVYEHSIKFTNIVNIDNLPEKVSGTAFSEDITFNDILIDYVLISDGNKISFDNIFNQVLANESIGGLFINFLCNEGTNAVNFNNIQNVGYFYYKMGYHYSALIGYAEGDITITNYIDNTIFSNNVVVPSDDEEETVETSAQIVGEYNGGHIDVSGYYTGGKSIYAVCNGECTVDSSNFELTNVFDLKTSDLAKVNDTYWEVPVVDGYTRMPMLKIATPYFQFDSVKKTDFKLVEGDQLYVGSILDNYLENTKMYSKNVDVLYDYEISNNDVLQVDNYSYTYGYLNFNAISNGDATITIKNYYDGLEATANVNVSDANTLYTIKFHYQDQTYTQNVSENTEYFIYDFNIGNGYYFPTELYLNDKYTGDSYSYYDYISTFTNYVTENDLLGTTIDLYAKKEIISYKMYFIVDGVRDSSLTKTFTVEDEIVMPTYSKTGYTLKGWKYFLSDGYSNWDSDKEYAPGEKVSGMYGAIYFEADFEANKYNIIYDAGGGTGTMATQIATYGQTNILNANTFTRDGYKFTNWLQENSTYALKDKATINLSTAMTKITDNNIKLIAQWEPINYTIAFDANGGTGTIDSISTTYDSEKTVPSCDFNKEGYTCIGFEAPDGKIYKSGDTLKNLTTEDSKTVTLKAKWEPISYTIAFDSNGGTGTMDAIEAKYDTQYSIPSCSFTKTGYTCISYEDESGNIYYKDDIITNLTISDGDTITLTAKWTPITYVIAFDSNGGTGTIESKTVTYDNEVTLPSCSFTKYGYTCSGYIDEDGKTYEAGSNIKNLISEDGKTITLKANWKELDYNIVHFDLNGGEGTLDDIKVYVGDNSNKWPTDVKREGYTLKTWKYTIGSHLYNINPGSSINYESSIPNETYTATANWEANGYYVNIYDDDTFTNLIKTVQVKYDQTYDSLYYPTKENYTFVGWYDEDGNEYKITDTVKITSDINVYTKYEAVPLNQYNVIYKIENHDGTYTTITSTYEGYADKNVAAPLLTSEQFSVNGFNIDEYAIPNTQYVAIASDNKASTTYTYNLGTYTIKFDSNGATGTMSDQQAKIYNDVRLNYNEFIKEGYHLTGWKYNETIYDPNTYNEAISNTVGDVVTLVAQWEANTYKVNLYTDNTFDNLSQTIEVTYDSKYNNLPVLIKDGYTFNGWYDKDGNLYQNTDDVKITSNLNLYPVFTEKEKVSYKVTYNIENLDGTFSTIEKAYYDLPNITVDAALLTEEELSNEGFDISDFNIPTIKQITIAEDNSSEVTYDYMRNSVYARFSGGNDKEYFEPSLSILYKTIKSGGTVGEVGDPDRTGYDFVGWDTADTCTSPVKDISNIVIKTNTTYYACWSKHIYTITYDDKNGNISTETYDVASTLTIPTPTSREGYIFIGWKLNQCFNSWDKEDFYQPGEEYEKMSGNISFEAVWSKKKYTIIFDANGGNGTMDSFEVDYDSSFTLPECTYTSDSACKGWFINTGSQLINFKAGDTVTNLYNYGTDTITFYADWDDVEFTYQINNYTVDNDYIESVSINTDKDAYLSNILLGTNYTASVEVNASGKVYTGAKTTIMNNGTVVKEYKNVVLGDINGDGTIDSADMLKLRRYLLKITQLNDVYYKAADPTKNSVIDSADMLAIRRHLLGIKKIG